MKNLLTSILDSDSQELLNFKHGYITAVVVILAFTIIFLIFRFIYKYPRKSQGVEIKGPNGAIFISSGAISDLVKSIGEEFEKIDISKVYLMEEKDFSYLEIQLSLDNDRESSFIKLSEDLQKGIIDTLRERFGVDEIKSVRINLKKIETRKSGF